MINKCDKFLLDTLSLLLCLCACNKMIQLSLLILLLICFRIYQILLIMSEYLETVHHQNHTLDDSILKNHY